MENELEEREIMTTEEDMDKNNNEDRRFYVYEHIRKDNNTCFYVGKGHGNRAYNLDRSNFHNSVRDEYGCRVKIIKDGLTEEEAFKLERERIEDYVITFGYGAPIDGYRDFSNNYLTNFTWGGEGISGLKRSEETKEKIRGENNPMFGKNAYANKTTEEMEIIRKKISEKVSGEKNGMFGKNPYANKTTEEMEEIRKNMSERIKGEKNPMWGKGKKVICITTGEEFDSINQAATHYNNYKVSKSTIIRCCKGKQKSAGELNSVRLQWKYAEDDDNESKAV